jgi:hypothetical protein
MAKKETIAEGLGLDSDWEILNEGKCLRCLADDDCPTISSSMEMRISQIQEEEMGISTPPSSYEKKLIMAGFEFAKHMTERKKRMLEMSGGLEDIIEDLVEKMKRDIDASLKEGKTPRFKFGGAPPGLLKKLKEMGLGEYIDDDQDDES